MSNCLIVALIIKLRTGGKIVWFSPKRIRNTLGSTILDSAKITFPFGHFVILYKGRYLEYRVNHHLVWYKHFLFFGKIGRLRDIFGNIIRI
jgi:uncharacterized protein (DUF3820 family)